MLRASRCCRPAPAGTAGFDHAAFDEVLGAVARDGLSALERLRTDLSEYRTALRLLDPDGLAREDALAFWINLYNAEMLELVRETRELGEVSVLRLPGAFDRPRVSVAGERLSPDDVEHGKIRRFGDPRVHAALVCGSASCPTLRGEAYSGPALADQLDDQMRRFLGDGGLVLDREAAEVRLSRIFLWYGADFVRPSSMPSLRRVTRRAVAGSLFPWLDPDTARWIASTRPRIRYQSYDWGVGCSVA